MEQKKKMKINKSVNNHRSRRNDNIRMRKLWSQVFQAGKQNDIYSVVIDRPLSNLAKASKRHATHGSMFVPLTPFIPLIPLVPLTPGNP